MLEKATMNSLAIKSKRSGGEGGSDAAAKAAASAAEAQQEQAMARAMEESRRESRAAFRRELDGKLRDMQDRKQTARHQQLVPASAKRARTHLERGDIDLRGFTSSDESSSSSASPAVFAGFIHALYLSGEWEYDDVHVALAQAGGSRQTWEERPEEREALFWRVVTLLKQNFESSSADLGGGGEKSGSGGIGGGSSGGSGGSSGSISGGSGGCGR